MLLTFTVFESSSTDAERGLFSFLFVLSFISIVMYRVFILLVIFSRISCRRRQRGQSEELQVVPTSAQSFTQVQQTNVYAVNHHGYHYQ
jgi:hypothetical protein